MLNQEEFFKKYAVKEIFEKIELKWETLEQIYDEYCTYRKEINFLCKELEDNLMDKLDGSFHSIRCRAKDPEHLIEKIIRKRGIEHNYKYKGINVSNYKEIVRDLIGVRILLFAKEDWEKIFDQIMILFSDTEAGIGSIAEQPVAYTRYGDRDIFKDKIHAKHSNKGYRSQHYVVKYKNYYCEIQVRTLSEEVYGEFDHIVKYPYRNSNKFLIRYTNTLSQLLDAVDELISTCFQMQENGWENCNQYYEDDKYIDWSNISQKTLESANTQKKSTVCPVTEHGIDAREYSADSLLRRR